MSTTKSGKTREKIYTAALGLMQEQGFEAATMRDIAKAAGLSAGASYYYFKSKDEIVLEFYLRHQASMVERAREIKQKHSEFKARVKYAIQIKFEDFQPYRNMLIVLAQNGVNPASPLSPFNPNTRDHREEAVAVFEDLIQDSGYQFHREVRPYMPFLFWLYQMGLLLYWIFDASVEQKRTAALLDRSLDIIFQLLKIQKLPFMGGPLRAVAKLLEQFT